MVDRGSHHFTSLRPEKQQSFWPEPRPRYANPSNARFIVAPKRVSGLDSELVEFLRFLCLKEKGVAKPPCNHLDTKTIGSIKVQAT